MSGGKFLFILIIVAVGLSMPYLLLNDEPYVCDKTMRDKSSGSFAKLSDGITHYELAGPENGPVLVLVHGVSGPMLVWEQTFQAFSQAGYRVLRYDLWGRGLSDRLHVDYNETLYDRQLSDLLKALKITAPVVMVGSSMGAIISTGFYNRHPKLVRRVILIGPAGFPIRTSPVSKFMNLPLVGEYLMGVLGAKTLREHHAKYFYKPENFSDVNMAFANQIRIEGTKKAILSTMRKMPVNNYRRGYEKLGASKIPVLLLWGKYDVTFPFSNHVKAQKYIPQAKFVAIDKAAHLPQYEAGEAVNTQISAFLQQ